MFTFFWTTVLFSLRASNTHTVTSALGRPFCSREFCITLTEGEITAEAGLCVAIPCSFIAAHGFTPKNIVWFKCESKTKKCRDSDIIFHTKHKKVPSEFLGRVSLLDPDVGQRNCSIMINDLTTSDSGSYQLRVNGLYNGKEDGFVFGQRTNVSVKDLRQRSTVTIPPLTEGQQATLTCTAPGLCSGSPPKITWMWRGKEENESMIGNITALRAENLTAVTQRHSSTLTLNPSAEHHNSKITCKVSFTGNITTEETLILKVNFNHVKDCGSGYGALPWVIAGVSLCVTVFCMICMWHLWNTRKKMKHNEVDQTYMYLEKADTSPEYDVIVHHKRQSHITGATTVKEGDTLNLTCSTDSFPQPLIVWTKHSPSGIHLHNDTGSATLVVSNVTAEDSGQYFCTATHLGSMVSVSADVKVTLFLKILKSSKCVLHTGVMTCVCITEGFPIPTIKWPLLKDHTEYSVTNMASDGIVNSTLTIRNHGNISVECTSSNENGEVRKNLIVHQDLSEGVNHVKDCGSGYGALPWVIAGVSLCVTVFCMICMWHLWNTRKKMKPTKVDQTYMSLEKADTSPEYDVIVQRPH
ncbi:sialic acid-binding Ig-like lectin 14 [Fundulus heteroclitus]|uniref:sialic acid-binding Ig-like lectin 14 n=1 Tax=Fundulus heteroclitus TaxID=8078 RepID=UPI00165AC8CB|nr:sialic acid-binding Ig-like lectin 14 [Fundulus heteroclitus]